MFYPLFSFDVSLPPFTLHLLVKLLVCEGMTAAELSLCQPLSPLAFFSCRRSAIFCSFFIPIHRPPPLHRSYLIDMPRYDYGDSNAANARAARIKEHQLKSRHASAGMVAKLTLAQMQEAETSAQMKKTSTGTFTKRRSEQQSDAKDSLRSLDGKLEDILNEHAHSERFSVHLVRVVLTSFRPYFCRVLCD